MKKLSNHSASQDLTGFWKYLCLADTLVKTYQVCKATNLILLMTLTLFLGACSTAAPEVVPVKETVIVEVTREVEVTRLVDMADTTATEGDESEEVEAATAVPVPPDSFNLLPMGDSLVEGWYWVPTFFYDHKDECNFWLVGSNEGDNVWVPSREGHGGATTGDFLAEQWHTRATETYDPDVILLMLGSNNYSDPDVNAETVAQELQQIVAEIQAIKEDVDIFVAIVPREGKKMGDYDAALQTLSNVTYIDQFSGFDPDTMTDDGIHPNELGSQTMADVYYAALQAAGYCP